MKKEEEVMELLIEVLIANAKTRKRIRREKINEEKIKKEVLRLFDKPMLIERSRTIWW